ncbi:MAG: ABC transporter substrate-binding protein [Chloroflexi bacterium]|nr:ABC transporter substrate-binding protein [Chloroflexota bacterium]
MRLNKKTKVLTLVTTVLLMVALLISSACAGAPPAEGPTKAVKVAYMAFSTGPVGDCGLPATNAGSDYFRWINDQGGIDGVKLDYMWIDTGYEVPRSVAAYQRLREFGAKIIWSFGTTPNDAIMQMAKEDGMPIMAWGGTSELFWPPNVFFATYMGYSEEARAALVWVKNNVPGLPAKPKVGMIFSDDAFGWASAHGPLYYEDEDGYEVVAHELLGHGALDATTPVRNVINAGADILLLHYTAGTNAVVVRDAIRLGFKGPIISTPQALDFALTELSEGAAEADNVYWLTYHNILEDKLPAMAPLAEMNKTYHPNDDPYHPSPSKCWEQGIIAPFSIVEGIRAAINQFGYENVTRANVIKGLESLSNLDAYGFQTMGFSPSDHRGSTEMAVFRLEGGNFKRVSDFFEAPEPADWEKKGQFKWK